MDPNPRQKRPDVRIVSSRTFDDVPFTIALDCSRAIDNGATAKIYKGEIQGSEPLVVAVKVFGEILSEVQEELLVRELCAAREVSLSHELILAFLGTADVGQQTAIVSLYMRNGNLMEYMKSHKDCDKMKLIRQVAVAVKFLHTTKNLVHGDIKCANVLISDFGDALLADFGLSTFVEKNQSASATKTLIRNMNTLPFAAPELLTGSAGPPTQPRSKTRESDVYAFGMLILEAATETLPWYGLTDVAIILRVSAGENPPRPMNGSLVSMSHAAWEYTGGSLAPTAKGREIYPVKSLYTSAAIHAIAYMPDGQHVVSGLEQGIIRVWGMRWGLPLARPMQAILSPILCVAVSPDNRQIACSRKDGTIHRWDAMSETFIGNPIRLLDPALCICYSPDGAYLVYGVGNDVRLWALSPGTNIERTLRGHHLSVTAVAFSPDGAHIASGSRDGTIHTWDSTSLVRLATLSEPGNKAVQSIAFSPDSVRIAAASPGQQLRIWDKSSGRLELEEALRSENPSAVAFSPSGKYIATLAQWRIRILDARTGELIGDRPCNNLFVPSMPVAFSPDGKSVFYTSYRKIFIWDLFT